MTRTLTHAVAFALGLVVLTSRIAFAGNPTGGCSEGTYGAACDHDGSSPCSGVCLPDFSQTGAPMSCLAADATALAGLQVTSLDGAGCSPSGVSGSDCTHSCKAGACVAANAAAGAECQPSDGGVNVCNGACDGNGDCSAIANGGEKYGRGEISVCLYTACQPLANAAGGWQFPIPAGTSCDVGDRCITAQTCNASGLCLGTPVSGCTTGGADGGLHARGDGGAGGAGGAGGGVSGNVDGGAHAEGASSGGCSIGVGGWKTGAGGAALLFALAAMAGRRRRAETR